MPAPYQRIEAKLEEHDARLRELGDYVALTAADVREMKSWLKDAGLDNGTGKKLRVLADFLEQRTEQMRRHEAWSVIRADLGGRVPVVLRRRLVWAAAAVGAAFMWGFGNRLNIVVFDFLHSHHVLGF